MFCSVRAADTTKASSCTSAVVPDVAAGAGAVWARLLVAVAAMARANAVAVANEKSCADARCARASGWFLVTITGLSLLVGGKSRQVSLREQMFVLKTTSRNRTQGMLSRFIFAMKISRFRRAQKFRAGRVSAQGWMFGLRMCRGVCEILTLVLKIQRFRKRPCLAIAFADSLVVESTGFFRAFEDANDGLD
jgi:hypothetical protein